MQYAYGIVLVVFVLPSATEMHEIVLSLCSFSQGLEIRVLKICFNLPTLSFSPIAYLCMNTHLNIQSEPEMFLFITYKRCENAIVLRHKLIFVRCKYSKRGCHKRLR